MKVFLDVGAHLGETLRIVRDARFAFDRIVSFEPVASCYLELTRYQTESVEICPFGLSKETSRLPVNNPGSVGASIYAKKNRPSETATTELAQFVQASDWFRSNLHDDDVVFLKLNCEGSECDILDDLMNSGEISKVQSMIVAFDIRKTNKSHKENHTKRSLERVRDLDWNVLNDVPGSTHAARIQFWLVEAGADQYSSLGLLQRFGSLARRVRYVSLPEVVYRSRAPKVLRRMVSARSYLRIKSMWKGYTFEAESPTHRGVGRR